MFLEYVEIIELFQQIKKKIPKFFDFFGISYKYAELYTFFQHIKKL